MRQLLRLFLLAACELTAFRAEAQPDLPRFTYGPRVGYVWQSFRHTGSAADRWQGVVRSRGGATIGAFAEYVASPHVRLRAELSYLTHAQWFDSSPRYPQSGYRTSYRAREIGLTPLVAVGGRWLFGVAGFECSHAIWSLVRGERPYQTRSGPTYQVFDEPYRNTGNVDVRFTLGCSAYIHRRVELSLRGITGGRFALFAPKDTGSSGFGFFRSPSPAQQALDAGAGGYNYGRYFGLRLTTAYHFGK